jgi:hypothetical protein
MGTGDQTKVGGIEDADKVYKVFEVNLVGPAGGGVVNVGKPLELRGGRRRAAEILSGLKCL